MDKLRRKIDTHCHVFPDAIAPKALNVLKGNCEYGLFADGTLSDTLKVQESWGCEAFVMLDIATSEWTVPVVNDFLISKNDNKNIFAFCNIYPGMSNYREELNRLEAAGIKGIKFHPGYQNFDMDDKSMFPVYEAIAERNMIILFHSGYDPAYEGSDCASPKRGGVVAENMRGAKIIMAHMGCAAGDPDVYEYLMDKDVYFDISMFYYGNDIDEYQRRIKARGPERCLYATDFPWSDGLKYEEMIESMNLTEQEKQDIFYNNAAKLLGIK